MNTLPNELLELLISYNTNIYFLLINNEFIERKKDLNINQNLHQIMSETFRKFTPEFIQFTYQMYGNFLKYNNYSYEAIKGGNLSVIKYLKSIKIELIDIYQNAAEYGQLDVIKWAKENGYEYYTDLISIHSKAVKNKHYELVLWLHNNGWRLDGYAFYDVVVANDIDGIKWLENQGLYIHATALEIYAEISNINTFKYLVEKLVGNISYETISHAARKGNTEVVKLLYKYNYVPSDTICCNAVASGNIELVKWLHSIGHNFNKDYIICNAAANDTSKVLEWMIEEGYEIFTRSVFYRALESGNMKLLKWFNDHNCPWTNIENVCCYGGSVDVIKFLLDNGYNINLKYICHEGAALNSTKLIKWAIENGYFYDHNVWYLCAKNGNVDLLRWAYDKNYIKQNDFNEIRKAYRYNPVSQIRDFLEYIT